MFTNFKEIVSCFFSIDATGSSTTDHMFPGNVPMRKEISPYPPIPGQVSWNHVSNDGDDDTLKEQFKFV